MTDKQTHKQKLLQKLLDRYRIVILNEDTFEERFSFKINRLNVIIGAGFSAIILIALTTVLIAFTPLREYIPGYSSSSLRLKASETSYKVDSLENVLDQNQKFLLSIKKVLQGEDEDDYADNEKNIGFVEKIDPIGIDFSPSKQDSLLRARVEMEDKYNLLEEAVYRGDFMLYPPVKGSISQGFDRFNGHFAVDIVAKENEPVKATANGTVIFAEWTVETGNVIIIEHSFGIISVYKHNAVVLKKIGRAHV
jgi:murein DD-endopeptidase MepM/ murein hydrolase activator NlpD